MPYEGSAEYEVERAPDTSVQSVGYDYVFRREGDYRTVIFEGRTVRLRNRKGLRYLARLLAAPGQEFHALDLVAAERGASDTYVAPMEPGLSYFAATDAGPILDGQAKAAYRRRLAEIEEDIEEARATGDVERRAQAEAEQDLLVHELARAVGLGGRDRRAGSASERARASVTRALREAVAGIHEHDPQLSTHLNRAIRTGTYCAYLPDARIPVTWQR
jgi:hypothetical protein